MGNGLIDINYIKVGQVESIEDSTDGLRIKARINGEEGKQIEDIPYAFPWMPKFFQVMPKVGESVFVFHANIGNSGSNRYYIGPIISQPQYMNKDEYGYGRGTSMSLLKGGYSDPLIGISNYGSTENAFPKPTDVAVVGRKSEDVILKEGEIALRCGIRKEENGEEGLVGHVVRNDDSPSYVQLKYAPSLTKMDEQEGNSAVNVVADRINLVSHRTKTPYEQSLTSKGELIKDEDMDNLMRQLHPLPYGDVLVEVLEKMRNAISQHIHPYPGMYPNNTMHVKVLNDTDLNEIKSEFVRIS